MLGKEESKDCGQRGVCVSVASEIVLLSYSPQRALGSEPAGPTIGLWKLYIASMSPAKLTMMPCASVWRAPAFASGGASSMAYFMASTTSMS